MLHMAAYQAKGKRSLKNHFYLYELATLRLVS